MIDRIDELAGYVTTARAAEMLQVKKDRVVQLVRTGKLNAKRWEDVYMVDLVSIEHYRATARRPGRPRKAESA